MVGELWNQEIEVVCLLVGGKGGKVMVGNSWSCADAIHASGGVPQMKQSPHIWGQPPHDLLWDTAVFWLALQVQSKTCNPAFLMVCGIRPNFIFCQFGTEHSRVLDPTQDSENATAVRGLKEKDQVHDTHQPLTGDGVNPFM